ncbi:MAG: NAD(P)H-dependent oxidoreductase, partial [Caldimonas sp.]
MAARRILIVQGHPDPAGGHFCHALAARYREGAAKAGHELRDVAVAQLDIPLLRRRREWASGPLPAGLGAAQQAIGWADHLAFFFPLWLGDMPALLKGFLEQVARPGFALGTTAEGGMGRKMLAGRSARVVVTMGMPALVYRWYFLAHSVRSLERNVLGFVGIAPVRRSLIGMVESADAAQHGKWLAAMQRLGERGA